MDRGAKVGVGVVLLGGLALSFPTSAHAAEQVSARLVYTVDAPSGPCASEVELRRKVATRLGYDPFDGRSSWLFRVRIEGRRKSPHAEIVTERDGKPSGKRELDEPTCEALSETVASTIAIAIDPVSATAPSEAPAPPTPEPSPAPLPLRSEAPSAAPRPSAAPTAAASAPTEHAPVIPLVYVDATAAIGRTAGVALGGRGAIGITYRALSIVGEARGEATPDAVRLSTRDSAYWSVLSGAVVACGHKSIFELCGVVALGSLQAKARDVDRPSLKGTFFASLGARAGVDVPLTADIALRANAELGIPLVRTTFIIAGEPAWTAPAVNGTLGVGVEARFR